ncbi:MAG TPA: hypothetical protein VFV17_02425, partial [Usitatibacteraceae bacterium]|nr:hypothetical protein [Usitatibacteraceae bacterium]
MRLLFVLFPALLLIAGPAFSAAIEPPDTAGTAQPLRQARVAPPVKRLIVKFTPEAATRGTLHPAQRVDWLSATSDAELTFVRTLATGADLFALDKPMAVDDARRLAATLRARADVEYAEPDEWMFPLRAANDTQYGNQWHL